jgi:hypothetical protein
MTTSHHVPSLRRAPLRRAAAGAALLALLPASAAAQGAHSAHGARPAPDAAPPSAAELVARHVEAVGGEAAVRRIASTRSTGTFAMPAVGLAGELTVTSAAPNRMRVRVVVPGFGEVANGYDGTVAWDVNPMQGPRLLEGKELERLHEESDFHGDMLRTYAGVVARETVERTELDGQACWRVRVTWRSGRETAECYAVETGLLVGTWSTQVSANGTAQVTTLLGGHREFGGVKLPTRVRQRVGAQEQVITLANVEVNVVEAEAFEPPPAIRTLLAARGR